MRRFLYYLFFFFIEDCEMLAEWKVSVLKIETEKGDLARNISKKKVREIRSYTNI